MILVGKKTILDEIEDAVKGFSLTEQCPLDFVILSNDEWAEAVEALNLTTGDTEFKHKGVFVVREGHIPRGRETRHYVNGYFR